MKKTEDQKSIKDTVNIILEQHSLNKLTEEGLKDLIGAIYLNKPKGVTEQNGTTVVYTKNGEAKTVALFTLKPLYVVRYKGEERYAYEITTQSQHKSKILLSQSDMIKYDALNAALKLNGISHVATSDYGSHSTQMLLYWTDPMKFKGKEKVGTEHIGLVMSEGEYFYVAPGNVYDISTGEETKNIEYIRQTISENKVSSMGNQKYDPIAWANVLREFATNVHKINRKETILPILGWITMLSHEYVMRRVVASGGGIPIMFLIGLPGSGKSATAKTLAPYFGWKDNAEYGKLSSGSEFGILSDMVSSYNVPTILDEYGKPNQKMSQSDIDELISAAYDKTSIRKGKADLSSVAYPIKSPLLIMGEQPPQTRSLQDRGLIVELDKSFLGNKDAEKSLNNLNRAKDKNFFAGMVIQQRQMYTNDDIANLFDKYTDVLEEMYNLDPRIRNKFLTVMVGLHCYIEMCMANGLTTYEIGVCMEDVLAIPKYLMVATENQRTNATVLERLFGGLNDFIDITSPGNKASDVIGKGKSVFVYTPQTDTYRVKINGKYENHVGYMKDKKCVALSIGPVYNAMKKHYGDVLNYNDQDIRNNIRSEFNKVSMSESKQGLVLCPGGYVVKGREFALFDYERVKEMAGGLIEYLETNN